MIKKLLTASLLFITVQVTSYSQSLIQRFEQVVSMKQTTKSMLQLLEQMPASPTQEAYIGAVTVCKAQEVMNPLSKYQYFRQGTKILENAIKKAPSNVEAIFLRHAIQTKSPSFLGYTKSLKGDRIFLNQALKDNIIKDKYLHNLISRFLKDNKL